MTDSKPIIEFTLDELVRQNLGEIEGPVESMNASGNLDAVRQARADSQSPKSTKSRAKKEVRPITDALWVEVPDVLRDLFGDQFLLNSSNELDDMRERIASIRRGAKKKGAGLAFKSLDDLMKQLGIADQAIQLASGDLRAARPSVLCGCDCPKEGLNCTLCGDAGYHTHQRYRELVESGDIKVKLFPWNRE